MDQAVATSSKRFDVPNKPCNKRRRSFTEALKEKYCTEENWDTDGFSIQIVLHGPPRNKEGGAELGFLTNVVLDRGFISHAGIPAGGLVSLCPNVVDLDLASNLIESWEEILPILLELRHLKFVNLARNPFKDTEVLKHWKEDLPSIENLVLNNTGLAWDDVTRLAQFMPHLKELHVCKNGYSKLSKERLGVLRNLECLRLNENRITRWEEVWKLRSLPKLSSLILSGNPLLEIFYRESDSERSGDTESTNQGPGPSKGDLETDIENRNGRSISESSVSSIENEIRDIELNFDDSDGDNDTIQNEEDNAEQSFDDLDDSNITEQCNSFVEDVMLKVIGRMLDNDQDKNDLDPCEGQAGGQGPERSNLENAGDQGSNSHQNGNFKTDRENQQTDVNCDQSHNSNNHNQVRMSDVPFSELRVLCVSETLLSKWNDLEALAKFPKLQQLRVKDVSLLCHVPMEERRKLFLASLPKITSLNGSEVTESERDKSERHFLRYFAKMKHKTERYAELVDKHG
ncbi:tubulin-specific chaperone cofactor E-like protein isoform X2 [Lineus longissimus]